MSGARKISPDDSNSGMILSEPFMHEEERVKHMSRLVPEASEVVCAACAAGDWGVDRDDEELFEVQASCRIAHKLGASHFGIQYISTRALETVVEMFREGGGGTVIVPLGAGVSFIP